MRTPEVEAAYAEEKKVTDTSRYRFENDPKVDEWCYGDIVKVTVNRFPYHEYRGKKILKHYIVSTCTETMFGYGEMDAKCIADRCLKMQRAGYLIITNPDHLRSVKAEHSHAILLKSQV